MPIDSIVTTTPDSSLHFSNSSSTEVIGFERVGIGFEIGPERYRLMSFSLDKNVDSRSFRPL